jgi:hypothetical protein
MPVEIYKSRVHRRFHGISDPTPNVLEIADLVSGGSALVEGRIGESRASLRLMFAAEDRPGPAS